MPRQAFAGWQAHHLETQDVNGEVPPDHVALAATALTAKRAIQIGAALKRGLAG